jgi:hypothetical protein
MDHSPHHSQAAHAYLLDDPSLIISWRGAAPQKHGRISAGNEICLVIEGLQLVGDALQLGGDG